MTSLGVKAPQLNKPLVHNAIGHKLLDDLLQEFGDIFEPPRGLQYYRINLAPGTAAVAVRPYCYQQLLKDEIERQCDDMLAQGIIRESNSTFSSPFLLVKKHDDSWRFCVDYRAINDKTIKDKFSIPVVDKLLDELEGAMFFTKLDLHSGYHQVHMHPANTSWPL